MAAQPIKPVLNIDDAALSERAHGEAFKVRLARVGSAVGLSKLGCSLHVVPPGKRAWPRHAHHESDELFFIISGTGEYRFGSESYPIRGGDLLGAPAGKTAHQIINTGTGELRYLAISSMSSFDVLEYPDSGKFGVAAGIQNGDFRTATFRYMGRTGPSLDYWEDE